MVTMSDVAERAGVSAKTVSRVMSGFQHVSPRTKERVHSAMRSLGYQPSMAIEARQWVSSGIGILYSDAGGGYQSRVNQSLLKACHDTQRYLVAEFFDESSANWREQMDGFLSRTSVRNLILLPPMCDSVELHAELDSRGVNYVLVSPSRLVPGATSIAMDDRLAAERMTAYLLDLGHEKIGYIGGKQGHIVSLLRQQGYEEALRKGGIVCISEYIVAGDFSFASGLKSAEKLLSLPDRPTAIFAANDEMAAAVVMTASRMQVKVPEDISVVGFDNTSIAETIWPALTTIAQPFDALALSALEALQALPLESSDVSQTRVLDFNLIVRGSCARPPEG